ncbi:MAG: hypothetical protein LIP03_14055 [Bacteroidales bacterium]|nr:hypothetical protein [Bacteroidales bacterium]
MIKEQPKVKPNERYTQKEASMALGISRQTLGVYTKKGYIRCRTSTINGRKAYLGSDLIAFWKKMF